MFARRGVLSLDGFPGSGADWLERFKPYIEDRKTIVVSPHRVWGPQTNDLVRQLRKRRISSVILGGMLANMWVESHLRDISNGVTATGALINFRCLAHAVLYIDDVLDAMKQP
jgi:hypothetical protein